MADRDPSAPASTEHVRGPVMLSATRIMKPGPARIGRLFGDVTLPRTVELPTLVAGISGAVFGLVVGLVVGGLRSMLYGATIFGALGVFMVTYSPLEGESMARWLGLTLRSRRKQTRWRGEPVQVSIGICPIDPGVEGAVRIVPGHVDVPPSQYDRRGVRISMTNQNTDEVGETQMWVPGGASGLGGAVGGAPTAWSNPALAGVGPARRLPERIEDDPVLAAKRGRLRHGASPEVATPVVSGTAQPASPEHADPFGADAAAQQDAVARPSDLAAPDRTAAAGHVIGVAGPVGPTPTGPMPTGPAPTDPAPAGPMPTGPAPTDPAPAGSAAAPAPTGGEVRRMRLGAQDTTKGKKKRKGKAGGLPTMPDGLGRQRRS